MAQVIIVSNRLPVSVKRVDGKLEFFPSVGGLATGLASYVTNKRNKWIGWPGIPSDELSEKEKKQVVDELAKHNCYPVFLRKKQLDDFYNGYSNNILWPLFHNLPPHLDDHERLFKAYKSVNEQFADTVLALSQKRSVIWVHDYQLLLMPEMLRAERPSGMIGLFSHIPFPPVEVFTQLPEAKKLVRGMLGANLIGFHTPSYANNFLDAAQQLDVGVTAPKQVIMPDRVVRVTDFPISIDYNKWAKASKSRAVKSAARKHRAKYRGQKIVLTVDRLDPTKGLTQRVAAYRELLKNNPKLHKKVVMVIIAVPSRTEIEDYKRLTVKLENMVSDINTTYGRGNWQPIDYNYTSLPFEELTALYQVADVAFIAPLRDGMNLVAKEYIASKPNKNGVLILSETAGAAEELTDALIVNPFKRSSLVSGLHTALTMPPKELKRRASRMQKHISTHTIDQWAGSFMRTVQRPIISSNLRTHSLKGKYKQQLLKDYKNSEKRLLLLDYDGVLSPFFSNPNEAKPSSVVTSLLGKLADDPRNEVCLVSGRSKTDLQAWFGSLPINLVAEHGALLRPKDSTRWQKTTGTSNKWQNEVSLIFERYAERTPGASVEYKQNSLVWHYRKASPYYAQKHLVALKRLLKPIAKRHGLEVMPGNKILEVRSNDTDKGVIALQLIDHNKDFVLAIGDDTTDEDMFTKLPEAYTIKVGRGRTAARFRSANIDDVIGLLKKMAS